MAYNIEFAYISQEIGDIYQKHGGFVEGNRILFCGFKTSQGLISGIHMRGGLYGQINKHFMNIFEKKILFPPEFQKYIQSPEKIGYCGLHATNIAGGCYKWKKYKQAKKQKEQNEFLEYLGNGNPLFQYELDSDFSLNATLIEYELSKTLNFR